MKKKNLKSLALNRKTISSLDATKNKGGIRINTEVECVLTFVDANGVNICIQTRKCESIFMPCITQTEYPTCRDCK